MVEEVVDESESDRASDARVEGEKTDHRTLTGVGTRGGGGRTSPKRHKDRFFSFLEERRKCIVLTDDDGSRWRWRRRLKISNRNVLLIGDLIIRY